MGIKRNLNKWNVVSDADSEPTIRTPIVAGTSASELPPAPPTYGELLEAQDSVIARADSNRMTQEQKEKLLQATLAEDRQVTTANVIVLVHQLRQKEPSGADKRSFAVYGAATTWLAENGHPEFEREDAVEAELTHKELFDWL
jgi:hypothetical protein